MLVKKIISAFLAFLLLVLFNFTIQDSCYSVFIPFIVSLIILKNSYDLYFTRKLCIADCFFNKNTKIYTIITGKIFILIISFIISVFLSTVLMLSIMSYTDNFMLQISILFIDIFILIFLQKLFMANKIIKKNKNNIFITNLTSWINAIFLSTIFMFYSLNAKPPAYINNDIFVTIKKASLKTTTKCKVLKKLLLISNGLDGMKNWILLNYQLNTTFNSYLLIVILFIGNFTMSFAYGRYILAITNLHNKKEKNETE